MQCLPTSPCKEWEYGDVLKVGLGEQKAYRHVAETRQGTCDAGQSVKRTHKKGLWHIKRQAAALFWLRLREIPFPLLSLDIALLSSSPVVFLLPSLSLIYLYFLLVSWVMALLQEPDAHSSWAKFVLSGGEPDSVAHANHISLLLPQIMSFPSSLDGECAHFASVVCRPFLKMVRLVLHPSRSLSGGVQCQPSPLSLPTDGQIQCGDLIWNS